MTSTLALFIPILALSIPIIAIIAGSYSKTHSGANPAFKNKILELEHKIIDLQTENRHMEESIRQLEDKQGFLTRLIEDKSK